MLARIRKSQESEAGFTLIELLVVIIIIGILAAIAIPTFLNQRKKGWVSAIKSDLSNAVLAEESWATGHNGVYTSALADLQSEGFHPTSTVTVVPTANTDPTTGFKLTASNSSYSGCDITFDSAVGSQVTTAGATC
jgi:type IV pilus assembly protein PilA